MERKLRVAMNDGMSCIVPTLVADDIVVILSNEVGYLAFPLISPLGTNEHGRWHVLLTFLIQTQP